MKLSPNNLRRIAILFFCVVTMTSAKSQCGENFYPVITGYYNYASGSKFGLGIEAGNIGDESNFGFYGGFKANFYSGKSALKDSKQEGGVMKTDFYAKGSWRFIRIPYRLSSYFVFSLHSKEFEIDFNSGVRILLPVRNDVAFSIEPGYYFRSKQMDINVNFHKILN